MKQRIPDLAEVEEYLGMLLPQAPSLDESKEPCAASHVAVYVNEADEPAAAVGFDIRAAASLGAALSMLPDDAVEDAVASGDLTNSMSGNLYEVANIFSRLLMSHRTPHLRLVSVDAAADAPAIDSVASAGFALDFQRYGSGRIEFACV